MNQRELAQKAMTIVADLSSAGGYLNPEQSNRFIRDLQDQPTLLNEIRIVSMNAPIRVIEAIGFANRILKVAPAATGSGGVALGSGDRSAPYTRKVTLTTKEVIAEVNIPYDVLEDNIERDNFEDTIMDMVTARVSLDLDELLVKGSKTAPTGDAYLDLFDGAIAMAGIAGAGSRGPHTVTLTSPDNAMGKNVFKQGIIEMPTRFLANRPAMRFWISPDNETEYRDTVADRQTGYGDQTLQGYRPVYAFGIPVASGVHIPATKMLFTHPKNLILGIQRDIMVETDRIIRERVIVIVVTLRIAIECEDRESLVVIDGIV
jgi:hypothetical protein